MDISRKRKSWITCLYAIPLACGLGAFASQVDGKDAPTDPVTCSSTGGTSTSPQAAAMINQELSERVRAALHAAPYFDDRHVDVTVVGGTVVLSGLVFSGSDLLDALQIARRAAGNRRVVDNLSIVDHLFIQQGS
jgi:osmotically-inducible protein OsmY